MADVIYMEAWLRKQAVQHANLARRLRDIGLKQAARAVEKRMDLYRVRERRMHNVRIKHMISGQS